MLMPYTTTATELQRNYKKVVKKAKLVKDAVIVLSNNSPEGVYMDYSTYLSKFTAINKKLEIDEKEKLLSLAGTMSSEDANELDNAIDIINERIDPEDWK